MLIFPASNAIGQIDHRNSFGSLSLGSSGRRLAPFQGFISPNRNFHPADLQTNSSFGLLGSRSRICSIRRWRDICSFRLDSRSRFHASRFGPAHGVRRRRLRVTTVTTTTVVRVRLDQQFGLLQSCLCLLFIAIGDVLEGFDDVF